MIRKTKIEAAAIVFAATLSPTTAAGRNLIAAIEAKYPGAIAKVKAENRKARLESRFEGDPPRWAKNLIDRYTPSTRLRWRRSRVKFLSSGRAWRSGWEGSRIVITAAGDDSDEQKYVVLHEIAHVLAPANERHGPRFWDTLYDLLTKEDHYRKTLASGHASMASLRAAARRARAARRETAA